MFERTKRGTGCGRYRARLEDSLSDGAAHLEADTELDAHVWGCVACREALDDALLASDLMSLEGAPAEEGSDAFVTRVMAAIREELARQTAPGAIWRPLELVASRSVLVAAVVLLALSLYLAGFAPPSHVPTITPQTEVSDGLPEPPALPSNEDEVLMSLPQSGTEF